MNIHIETIVTVMSPFVTNINLFLPKQFAANIPSNAAIAFHDRRIAEPTFGLTVYFWGWSGSPENIWAE